MTSGDIQLVRDFLPPRRRNSECCPECAGINAAHEVLDRLAPDLHQEVVLEPEKALRRKECPYCNS